MTVKSGTLDRKTKDGRHATAALEPRSFIAFIQVRVGIK